MLEDKTRRRFTASCSHRLDDDQDPDKLEKPESRGSAKYGDASYHRCYLLAGSFMKCAVMLCV